MANTPNTPHQNKEPNYLRQMLLCILWLLGLLIAMLIYHRLWGAYLFWTFAWMWIWPDVVSDSLVEDFGQYGHLVWWKSRWRIDPSTPTSLEDVLYYHMNDNEIFYYLNDDLLVFKFYARKAWVQDWNMGDLEEEEHFYEVEDAYFEMYKKYLALLKKLNSNFTRIDLRQRRIIIKLITAWYWFWIIVGITIWTITWWRIEWYPNWFDSYLFICYAIPIAWHFNYRLRVSFHYALLYAAVATWHFAFLGFTNVDSSIRWVPCLYFLIMFFFILNGTYLEEAWVTRWAADFEKQKRRYLYYQKYHIVLKPIKILKFAWVMMVATNNEFGEEDIFPDAWHVDLIVEFYAALGVLFIKKNPIYKEKDYEKLTKLEIEIHSVIEEYAAKLQYWETNIFVPDPTEKYVPVDENFISGDVIIHESSHYKMGDKAREEYLYNADYLRGVRQFWRNIKEEADRKERQEEMARNQLMKIKAAQRQEHMRDTERLSIYSNPPLFYVPEDNPDEALKTFVPIGQFWLSKTELSVQHCLCAWMPESVVKSILAKWDKGEPVWRRAGDLWWLRYSTLGISPNNFIGLWKHEIATPLYTNKSKKFSLLLSNSCVSWGTPLPYIDFSGGYFSVNRISVLVHQFLDLHDLDWDLARSTATSDYYSSVRNARKTLNSLTILDGDSSCIFDNPSQELANIRRKFMKKVASSPKSKGKLRAVLPYKNWRLKRYGLHRFNLIKKGMMVYFTDIWLQKQYLLYEELMLRRFSLVTQRTVFLEKLYVLDQRQMELEQGYLGIDKKIIELDRQISELQIPESEEGAFWERPRLSKAQFIKRLRVRLPEWQLFLQNYRTFMVKRTEQLANIEAISDEKMDNLEYNIIDDPMFTFAYPWRIQGLVLLYKLKRFLFGPDFDKKKEKKY